MGMQPQSSLSKLRQGGNDTPITLCFPTNSDDIKLVGVRGLREFFECRQAMQGFVS